MQERRKIALLAGQADEARQSRFIKGLLEQAFSEDCDVFIFSMYRKYQDTEIREAAEMNIYNLFDPCDYDGIIILKDSIQTPMSSTKIEVRIKDVYDGPVLVIDRESDYFETLWENDYEGMRRIVEHLIDVHGYEDIAFVSGKRWHRHAMNRLRAYEDVLKNYDIPIREERIFHGDFWYSSGELAVKEFIESPLGLPEAIVCANDEMAIGVCNALSELGIKIPKDIAVAGFDSVEEGRLSPLAITSCDMPYEDMGRYAVECIKDRIAGRKSKPFKAVPDFLNGQTCGCKFSKNEIYKAFSPCRHSWGTDRMCESHDDVYNMMEKNLMVQSDLSSFLGTVYSYAYQLKDAERFSLCLSLPWKKIDDDHLITVNNKGYPDKSVLAIDYNSLTNIGTINTDDAFDTKMLHPYIGEDRDHPCAYTFTPFYCENECFGYAMISYGDSPRGYDRVYREWMEDVCRGFEVLRRTLLMLNSRKLLESMRTSKYAIGNARYENLSPEDKAKCDLVSRILDDNLLVYHFQPIVRARDGEIYSYEALMRATTEERISPLEIIKYAGILGRLQDVEKATFFNILSFFEDNREKFGSNKVFINSIPGVTLEREDYSKITELLKRNGQSAVVEFTEEAEMSDDELQRFNDHFSKLGVEVAIDDFGTGYSNINNLLRYTPNCVKIDRSLLSRIESKPQNQHFVREIIKFCHDSGSLSLAEGVETQAELRTVIHMGVDLIQGFYTAKPSAEPIQRIDGNIRNEICLYYQEKEDGFEKQVYIAGNSNRVSLALIAKYGCTDIIVGKEGTIYKDVSIIGAPNLETEIHIQVLPGYQGEITLENVDLSNIKGRPCIDIAEECDVIIKLEGNNRLRGIGIRVNRTASLELSGDGNLIIETNDPQYYGIGNDIDSEHGRLFFNQDGKITITGNGLTGVGIGSGTGGVIRIEKGQYSLRVGGKRTVGIGSILKGKKIDVINCNLEMDLNSSHGVGIGSLDGESHVLITKASTHLMCGGNNLTAVGSCTGNKARVEIEDASVDISMRSNNATCLGTLAGVSDLDIRSAGVRMDSMGKNALAFGGVEKETYIRIESSDLRADIHNSLNKDTYASDDDISLVNGRIRIEVNDEEIKREMKIVGFDELS